MKKYSLLKVLVVIISIANFLYTKSYSASSEITTLESEKNWPSKVASNTENKTHFKPAIYLYEVKPGDTLTDISMKMLGTFRYYSVLAEANNLENPDILEKNTQLLLYPHTNYLSRNSERFIKEGLIIPLQEISESDHTYRMNESESNKELIPGSNVKTIDKYSLLKTRLEKKLQIMQNRRRSRKEFKKDDQNI